MHTTTEEVGNGHNAATTWDNIKMRHYMQARYKRHTHSPEDNISTWWSLVSERHSMHVTLVNKSSAVAEMGDRLAQWGWAEKGGVLYHFPWWDLGPHLTQCGLGWGLPPHQVASWSMQPFGHNRHGPKIGGSDPLLRKGAGSPSNTMLLGSRPTSIPSDILIMQPFGHNR